MKNQQIAVRRPADAVPQRGLTIWACFSCGSRYQCKHREPELLMWAMSGARPIRERNSPIERRNRYLQETGRMADSLAQGRRLAGAAGKDGRS